MRRATAIYKKCPTAKNDFYPRSPCGERLDTSKDVIKTTSNFYPRSPCGERRVTVLGIQHRVGISIHALLAESDSWPRAMNPSCLYFYPRSPCGERRCDNMEMHKFIVISIHALLAESDLKSLKISTRPCPFLSTLSLRRATDNGRLLSADHFISIHALLAESDVTVWGYSDVHPMISIHALLAESDRDLTLFPVLLDYFYPRSPCGERQQATPLMPSAMAFLSTLSLRRATALRFAV